MHKIIETFRHEITLYKLILSANTLKKKFIFVNFIEQLNREKLSIRNQVKLLYFAKIQSKRDINKNTFQSIDKKKITSYSLWTTKHLKSRGRNTKHTKHHTTAR